MVLIVVLVFAALLLVSALPAVAEPPGGFGFCPGKGKLVNTPQGEKGHCSISTITTI